MGMERILKDGSTVVLRPIRPDDKQSLARALGMLSPASVYARFLGPKPRFTTSELRYLTEVDGHDHVAVVAERPDEPGTFVAVGRWVRLPEQPQAAEFAIVVGDHLQGLGLGSILADELARRAKAEGVTRFTASVLSENAAIVRVMARLATHLERHHDGHGHAEVAFDLAA
jgi:RimJ/RimL family protein N-acetyltransferase